MNICVYGLWHLGSVTAACLAAARHRVTGFDPDGERVEKLNRAEPPLFEPGLAELIRAGIDGGTLRFTADAAEALRDAAIVWVTFDTPVDRNDRADTASVMSAVERLFDKLADDTLVVVSSQLPVGSVAMLEQAYAKRRRRERVTFACSPENLRLGRAIDAFARPDRIVAGVRSDEDREKFSKVMAPITTSIEWMSVESAEMAKHALNAFLATSVAFINEIAVVCEEVGADARDVERALKSDPRIGARAYLSPGGPFAGGTLARDIEFLGGSRDLPLIRAVKKSNDRHRAWARSRLQSAFRKLRGRTIAVWGLTYKPGTDTLRRSASMELCAWLLDEGAKVVAHDPAVKSVPEKHIRLTSTPEEALQGADALVVATEWPEYRDVAATALAGRDLVVIDANRFLAETAASLPRLRYFTVGKP
jgi:UDPglucose 6-dehydrogenase